MGLLGVNHPFIPFSTLINTSVKILHIRDYVPLYIGMQLVFFREYFRLKEDRECMNKHNIEVRLSTDCCRGKALSVIYSEFLCGCVEF